MSLRRITGRTLTAAAVALAWVVMLPPAAEAAAPEGITERVSVTSNGSEADASSTMSFVTAHGRTPGSPVVP